MVDKQSIIHLRRVENLSGRSIARKLGISRTCVTKVLKEYEAACLESAQKVEALLTEASRYDSSKRTGKVLVDSVTAFIDKCIDSNKLKGTIGMSKQRMQKQDIHRELLNKGFLVSYSSVCKYVTSKEAKGKSGSTEAFIRQEYSPGEICEFDWGEVKLTIDGKREKLFMAVFTLCYSNGRFAFLFRHQDTLAFLESHRNFFHDAGGVPLMMVYDNMRVAISKFTQRQKKPTEALLRMATFYGLGYRFCNVRRGNEKGHVERSVEYVRRRAFCQVDSFDSISQAQRYLSLSCKELNREAHSPATADMENRFPRDLAALREKRGDMGCFELKQLQVDKWATLCHEGIHYSVPDKYVGQLMAVKIFSNRIRVIINGQTIAEHEKPSEGKWCINIDHYLDTFSRKPGALAASTAMMQASEIIRHIFHSHFKQRPDEFVKLLMYMREKKLPQETLYRAYNNLTARGIREITTDQIIVTMHVCNETQTPPNTHLGAVEIERNSMHTLNQITALMEQTAAATIN